MVNPCDEIVTPVEQTYPILKVAGLTALQGQYVAVRDVSFELWAGTSTAIVGPNGSGKSTLVQAILSLIPRSAGQVEIFGRPMARLGDLRHQIGYVPQNFIFDRSFPISVAELVGLGWVPPNTLSQKATRGKPSFSFTYPWQKNPAKQAAILQALRRVDADHLRDQAIGTLSGGELKRVLLAYCLVIPRSLLILDEAFAGVDVQGEADFYDLLNELKHQENWTILQVSHDLEMVSHHCDQILCLNQTLVCSGKPEVALSPQNLLATYGPAFSRYQHRH
jgi:zinc transport system ATP-binding protein